MDAQSDAFAHAGTCANLLTKHKIIYISYALLLVNIKPALSPPTNLSLGSLGSRIELGLHGVSTE